MRQVLDNIYYSRVKEKLYHSASLMSNAKPVHCFSGRLLFAQAPLSQSYLLREVNQLFLQVDRKEREEARKAKEAEEAANEAEVNIK